MNANVCDSCSNDLPPINSALCDPCAFDLGFITDKQLEQLAEWGAA